MKRTETVRQHLLSLTTTTVAVLAACAALPFSSAAQSGHPTAIQLLQLSAFGGATGVYTGLSGGKNFSITAGADLALPELRHVRPTLEFRGTYPTDRGTIDSQRSALGGLRVDYPLGHRIRPYADFLIGRGQMNYGQGYRFNNHLYVLTTAMVYSPGVGFDYPLTDHFSVKVDGQLQRWSSVSVPTDRGILYSKQGTLGLVYIIDFNRHHH